jgi:hypothetical protein
MPGRMYAAVFKDVAVTAVQDLFEVAGPSDAITVVHRVMLTQSTETGDAAEEMLRLTTNRGVGSVTSGSGGGSVTPQPVSDGDAAFGGTVERNNTTAMAAGSGSLEELESFAWNVRVPFDLIWLPEFRPVISPGNRWTLELESAPADSVTMSGTLWFEEIGG